MEIKLDWMKYNDLWRQSCDETYQKIVLNSKGPDRHYVLARLDHLMAHGFALLETIENDLDAEKNI